MPSYKWPILQNRCTFQALTNPPSCITALYTKTYQEIGAQCSLPVFHTSSAFQPIIIMSNLWIFISIPTMPGSAITMISPDKVTGLSVFQQPFYILKLPPAYSATLRHFHLCPHYEDHVVTMHVSLNKANLNTINISTPDCHIWRHLIGTGLQLTCRNWQMYPRSPSYSSTSTGLAKMSLSYHLKSIEIWKKDLP